MESTTADKFRNNLKSYVEHAASQHAPLRVKRRNGADFIVMSAEDWERDQETLWVLQNTGLMQQIAESMENDKTGTGYMPTRRQIDEILGV